MTVCENHGHGAPACVAITYADDDPVRVLLVCDACLLLKVFEAEGRHLLVTAVGQAPKTGTALDWVGVAEVFDGEITRVGRKLDELRDMIAAEDGSGPHAITSRTVLGILDGLPTAKGQ